jgi:hypothetical protein
MQKADWPAIISRAAGVAVLLAAGLWAATPQGNFVTRIFDSHSTPADSIRHPSHFVLSVSLLPAQVLLGVALVPAIRGESGILYLAGTLVLGCAFLHYSARFVFRMSTVSARQLLFCFHSLSSGIVCFARVGQEMNMKGTP